MVINVDDIFTKKIETKYENLQSDEFQRDFSKKERAMWEFTYILLKDEWPTKEFDLDLIEVSSNFNSILDSFLEFYGDNNAFTLKEWVDYMKKMY